MTLSDETVRRLRQLALDVPRPPERYVLHEIIGQGGMGTVYRAHDTVLSRDVAFKLLDARSQWAADASARLRREATILAQLEHPGIVPVYDAGELDNGSAFYVMQLVRGERLDEYVARGISRGDVLRLLLRLCEIVAFANAQGVVHRDLKPGNIMIGPFGEILLLDWGVAKVLIISQRTEPSPSADGVFRAEPFTDATIDGVIVGTPGYMAPEQASGDSAHVTQTADVYALGVIMREVLRATSAPTSVPTSDPINRALRAIADRAAAAESRDRYGSAGALADDVRRWLDGQTVSAYRETLLEQTLRVYRQHQVAVFLVATYLVVRVVILLWRHI